MSNSIKKGFVWTALEKFSIQIVQFVLGIIIARFVTPSEYGVLGILMVFITISQVFIDSGLGSAIIYKNNLDEDDLQTTFSFNLIISTVLVVLITFFANYIEIFFKTEGLALYLVVSIFVLIINAFQLVPSTILRVKLNFKAVAISNFTSTLLSGIVGATFAVCGFGVWSLIVQLLSKSIIQTILINIQCQWKPRFYFKSKAFSSMYTYSVSIFGTACITKATTEGLSMCIAKILTPYSLGIFTRANQFASLTGTSIGSIFNSVLFPAFSSIREDRTRFQSLFKKIITVQGFFVIPCFAFLALLSKPLILLLLTEKWLDVVVVLQILCIGRILSTISIGTEQALCAVGRSDLLFKQQSIKLGLKIIALVIGFYWGLLGVAVADAISTILSFFTTNHVAKGNIPFGSAKQLYILSPYLVAATISSLVSYYAVSIINDPFLQLLLGAFVAITLYILILLLTCKQEVLTILLFKRKSL